MYNRISSQAEVICCLQFHTYNWTGDQQSTVLVVMTNLTQLSPLEMA